MKFKQGESYLWICLVGGVIFIVASAASAALVGNPALGSLAFPCFGAFILVSQIRSEIALDGIGVAKHVKGTWQYSATLAWLTVWTLGTVVVSCLAISVFAFQK